MRRMKCIGAQSVADPREAGKPLLRPLTNNATPRAQRLMVLRPCRRDAGTGVSRSYVMVQDEAAVTAAKQQLSLFTE